ncbi:carboxymuconolactone decarboxylase family protein [Kitasatospora sp. GP82]|uniref:carboxymuconolactone decarboxylase family protein n=1 Tax=Kitasatospora sp. GP82 TaxID=3035089 RepID=UPI0024738B22|nr:carboxymuconolactone decarboxylase family protein [Kitasatospora sp. GP82]MDH6124911.1 alkylhydroperoxidase family enzyme [Kitasatospora sp. GP82]
MAGAVLRSALRRSLGQVRHVSPVRVPRAGERVGRIYAELEREFGMLAPPVALHSPAPEVLAACWMLLRETLVATGSVDRAVKEAVATAVSGANSCPYCVEVHGMTLRQLLDPAGPELGAVAEWARSGGARPAPFPAAHAPELVGVAVTFHYLNRMVNIFLPESPLPTGAPPALRTRATGLLGRFLGPAARRHWAPGGSLDLLPSAALPADLAWAAATPSVAGAFARAAAAAESAGARTVPEPVRGLVRAELAGWDGRPKGPSRAWVNDAVAGLPPAQRAVGRLALLTALASYQVDQSIVADFRQERPGDTALIELTFWAAFAAAREMGTRLTAPANS